MGAMLAYLEETYKDKLRFTSSVDEHNNMDEYRREMIATIEIRDEHNIYFYGKIKSDGDGNYNFTPAGIASKIELEFNYQENKWVVNRSLFPDVIVPMPLPIDPTTDEVDKETLDAQMQKITKYLAETNKLEKEAAIRNEQAWKSRLGDDKGEENDKGEEGDNGE